MMKNIFLNPLRLVGSFFRWYISIFRGRRWYIKFFSALMSIVVATILYFIAVDINFLWLFGKSPGFASIRKPNTAQASVIYSADGKMIGKYFNENRMPVEFEDVNPVFWDALVSTEDERFFRHHGVDFIGMGGAIKDALTDAGGRGASTITQQLAKNMFRVRTQYSTGLLGKIPGIKILIMKSKEWIIATKIEMLYSKKQILTMYANTVDFGSNAYGIKTASQTYFGVTPKELSAEQAAVLVGMLKATTTYNPISNPENSKYRRNVVLNNMQKLGYITAIERDSLSQLPLTLDFRLEKNYDGYAQYFREAVARHLDDWCEQNGYDLYSSGLKIYTTIDTRMQKYAEDAAKKQMQILQGRFNSHWGNQEPWRDEKGNIIPHFIEDIAKKLPVYRHLCDKYNNNLDSVDFYLNKPHLVKLFDYERGQIEREMSTMDSIRYMVSFLHCGFVAMEPQTGHVKAWVGDVDFDSWKYDKVKAMRQPGSTFKLFVYAEAFNQGLTPCTKRRDEYVAIDVFDLKKNETVTWTPHNSDGRFTGDSLPLKTAFARSTNSIAVKLGQEVVVSNIIKTAHAMGIKSRLIDEPSLTLGSSDVNLLELTNSYATVANQGKYMQPVLVTRIVDRNGNEVYNAPTADSQAIPLRTAVLLQQILMTGVRDGYGTSQPLWGFIGNVRDTDFGGKTGTSNNHSDAWFMAVSPRLVVGSWIGGEYRSIHFRTGALGQGSRTALPLCGYFLQSVFNDPQFSKYHAKFERPSEDVVSADEYECSSSATSGRQYQAVDSLDYLDENYLDPDGNIREDLRFPEGSDLNPVESRQKNEAVENKNSTTLTIEDF